MRTTFVLGTPTVASRKNLFEVPGAPPHVHNAVPEEGNRYAYTSGNVSAEWHGEKTGLHPSTEASSTTLLSYTIIEENDALVIAAEMPPSLRSVLVGLKPVLKLVLIDTDGQMHVADGDLVPGEPDDPAQPNTSVQARFVEITPERIQTVRLVVIPSF